MNEAIASWVPAPVLALIMLGMGAWIWKNLSKRLDTIETAINELHKFATLDQLGTMGNRFDERNRDTSEKIGALGERLARLEGERE